MDMVAIEQDLKGQHITVLPFETYVAMHIKRNESGNIEEMVGYSVPVFNWIVTSMNLTYTWLQDDVRKFEDVVVNGELRLGTISYCVEKKTDVVIGDCLMSADVYEMVDVVRLETLELAFTIPAPLSTTYLGGSWLPFTFLVWLIVLLSVAALVGLLYVFSRFESNHMTSTETTITSRMTNFYNALDYTLRTLISQGTSCPSKMMAFRVLAASWAIGSFLLVNYYNSILTSFFTAPNYRPLIKSPYDLPKNPNIKVTSAIGPATFFFKNAEEGMEKYMGDMWKNDPKLLCKEESECLDQVLKGSRAYINMYAHLKHFLGVDVEETGKCRFTIAEETFHMFHGGFQLPKGSKFTQIFSQKILYVEAFGLINYWKRSKQMTDAERCLNYKNQGPDDGAPLTFINLSSAFIILPVGWFISLVMFFIEKRYSKMKTICERFSQKVPAAVFWFLIFLSFHEIGKP